MTRRDDEEIRREIERWKRVVVECRGQRERVIDGAAAAVIASALTWALGGSPSPTTRVVVR